MGEKSLATTTATVSASKVIGESVINRQQETLARSTNWCSTWNQAESPTRFFHSRIHGNGQQALRPSWKALELSPTEMKLVLNVDKEKLKNAPGSTRRTGLTSRTRHGQDHPQLLRFRQVPADLRSPHRALVDRIQSLRKRLISPGLRPPRPSRSESAAASRTGSPIFRRHPSRSRVARSLCPYRARAT